MVAETENEVFHVMQDPVFAQLHFVRLAAERADVAVGIHRRKQIVDEFFAAEQDLAAAAVFRQHAAGGNDFPRADVFPAVFP